MFNGFGLFNNPGLGSLGGGGGSSSYISVATYADLPAASDHTGDIYVVYTSTGTWLIDRKEAGLYRSNGSTWSRLGNWLDAFKDSNFTLYNSADNSKMAHFDVSYLNTLSSQTYYLPTTGGTVALISDVPEIFTNQDFDDSLNPTVYVGKLSNFNNWKVKKVSGDGIITTATSLNNPLIVSYSVAWSDRLTLTYT